MMKTTVATALLMSLLSGPMFAADLAGAALKVGSDTTSPPMEFVDPATGQIAGFDVDVVTAIDCEDHRAAVAVLGREFHGGII